MKEIKGKIKEANNANLYSQEEEEIATKKIVDFLDMVKQMRVLEDNQERPLNELEKFIAIDEFVANREYLECKKAHDIIGVCNTGKGVCEGFCKLTELLCNQLGINTVYKHSNNKKGDHGNMEICLKDRNGKNHCLHYDPTIDCLCEKDIMTYNATLIPDDNVNKYYNKQNWYADDMLFINIMEGRTPSFKPGQVELFLGKTEEEIEKDRIEEYRPKIIKLANFMRVDYDTNLSTKEEILDSYEKIYNQYQENKQPIDNVEFLQALLNVQIANLSYNTNLSQEEIVEKSKKILRERIEKSIELQKERWESDCSDSFIVDIVNGKFDYNKELENATNISIRESFINNLRNGVSVSNTIENTTDKLDTVDKYEGERSER